MKDGKLIGEILVEKGYISKADMDAGLTHAQAVGKRLGESLVELGLLTYDQLYDALAEKFAMPLIELYPDMLSDELWRTIPRSTIVKYGIIPIFKDQSTIHVVTSDPTNIAFREELEKETGCRIEICLAKQSVISSLIARWLDLSDAASIQATDSIKSIFLTAQQQGAVQLLALTRLGTANIYFRKTFHWIKFDRGERPRQLINWLKNINDLPDNYQGSIYMELIFENNLLPMRIDFSTLSSGERLSVILGREMASENTFTLPGQKELQETVLAGGWITLIGTDPWIIPLATALLPTGAEDHTGWIAVTIPGTPLPDGIPGITITGTDTNEFLSALEAADRIKPDGLILDWALDIPKAAWRILLALQASGCAIIFIRHGAGPYFFPEIRSEFFPVPPVIITVTRLRRTCRSCRKSYQPQSSLKFQLPESVASKLSEAPGCRICKGGALGTLTFIEKLRFFRNQWRLPSGILYPNPGTTWEKYPTGSTPANVFNRIESIFASDVLAIRNGWRISYEKGE